MLFLRRILDRAIVRRAQGSAIRTTVLGTHTLKMLTYVKDLVVFLTKQSGGFVHGQVHSSRRLPAGTAEQGSADDVCGNRTGHRRQVAPEFSSISGLVEQ